LTPTPTPTATPTRLARPEATIYLPLILKQSNTPPPTDLVNGNFEQGATGWYQYSTHGWPLIVQTNDLPPGVAPHSGGWAVWLGGDDDDISFIRQQVTIPTNQPYLTYWHWIASGDTCGYDFSGVIVNNVTVVDVYDLCTTENTGGWVRHSVNLGDYRGRSVSVQIRAETDSSVNSNLFVDDVSFQASAVSEAAKPAGDDPSAPMPKINRLVPGTAMPGNENRVFHQ
jgi:hypothetical protein